MEGHLTVVGRLIAKAGQEVALRDALVAVSEASRREPGCINYDLHVDRDDPGRFLIYENWVSEAALDAHFDLPHSRALSARFPELLACPLSMERLTEITPWAGRRGAARRRGSRSENHDPTSSSCGPRVTNGPSAVDGRQVMR